MFALTGKVTSIFIGPLLIGTITAVTASQKAGMAVLVVFFVAGLALLMRVRENWRSELRESHRDFFVVPGFALRRAPE